MSVVPHVAILCGGQGTRLRAALPDLPKSLAPMGGRPFLERLVETLLAQGSERIVLCTGCGGERIRAHFAAHPGAAALYCSQESAPLGTGGALGLAWPHLHSDPVLVMNGDSMVLGLDYADLARSHRERGAAVSVVVVPADGRRDVGWIVLAESGRIQSFAEKQPVPGAVLQNAGVYLVRRQLLQQIPPDRRLSLEEDLLPDWLRQGGFGYLRNGELIDIGTPERLRLAQARVAAEAWGRRP